MEYRKLGSSDLNISAITLGAWQYGNEQQWGKVPLKDINQVIIGSIKSGINIIDTAIVYADSEKIVGNAIKGIRGKVIIVSKCGADPKKIPYQIDFSLKRMDLDYIDLYLVHVPDADIAIEDTMEAMAKIKEAGKVRYIGVSNFNKEQLAKAVSVTDITCCESPYNLIWKEIEQTGVASFCYEKNIGILTYSSLGQGLFTGKIKSQNDIPEGDIRHHTLFFKGDIFKVGLEIVKTLEDLSKKYNKTVAQIALNWVIDHKYVTSAICGIIKKEELYDNLGAVGWRMEKEDFELLSSKADPI